MSRLLKGSIELSKLKHVIEKRNGKNGPILAITLPIDANFIETYKKEGKKDRYFLSIEQRINDSADNYGNISSIKQNLPGKNYKDICEKESADIAKEKSKALPYIGNLKDFENKSTTQTAAITAITEVQADSDDIPF